MPPKIKENECVGCGACVDACPNNVLEIVDGVCKVMNPSKCTDCWVCVESCPIQVIQEGSKKRD